MPERARGLEALVPLVQGRPDAMVALAGQMYSIGNRERAIELCTRAIALPSCDDETRAHARELLSADVPDWHFAIVRDSARNDAYEAALQRVIFSGCRVLEIGTGTGLLTMMAARAGAAEVITCEANPAVAAVAREIVAANGYADRVRVIPKHSTALDVAEDMGGRADILVSEIVSNDLLSEEVLPAVEHAAQHLLKPGAVMIPRCGRIRVALAEDTKSEGTAMDISSGFDLAIFNRLRKPLRQFSVENPRLVMRSAPRDLFVFDFASGGPFAEERTSLALASAGGSVNGVAQWIALDLDHESTYENQPGVGEASCWGINFHPTETPVSTVDGEAVRVGARHRRTSLSIWVKRHRK